MKISEIICESSYLENMIVVVQDILAQLIAQNVTEISTDKFQALLAKQGHNVPVPELIQLIDKSQFASSVDGTTIRPANQLPGDLADKAKRATKDLSTPANVRSMNNIKKGNDLPA